MVDVDDMVSELFGGCEVHGRFIRVVVLLHFVPVLGVLFWSFRHHFVMGVRVRMLCWAGTRVLRPKQTLII